MRPKEVNVPTAGGRRKETMGTQNHSTMKDRLLILLIGFSIGLSLQALEKDADGYYLIGTSADLVAFSNIVNEGESGANAKLTADIDMSSVENFTPIGRYTDDGTLAQTYPNHDYRGTFDGQGHIIRNLTIIIDNEFETGLFGRTVFATLKNLGVENATVRNNAYVRTGVFAGEFHHSNMTNCFTVGELEVFSEKPAYADDVAVEVGGLTGEANMSKVQNCYTTVERLYGGNSEAPINCYAAADVEGSISTGKLCYMLNVGQSETVWYQTLGEDEYPIQDNTHMQVYAVGTLRCDGKDNGQSTYSNEFCTPIIPPHEYNEEGYCTVCGQEGYVVTPTADGWYEVTNAMELRYVSRYVNRGNPSINIRIMNDIDMDEIPNFPPIGSYSDEPTAPKVCFKGTIDGQHHILNNLNIAVEDGTEAGLVSRGISPCRVMNLGVVNATILQNGAVRCGVFAGEMNGGTIENCFSTGNIFLTTAHPQAGGICGEAAQGKLVNCWSTYEGMAQAAGTLTNCFFYDENDYPNIAEEAETGALCWKLNGASVFDVIWYQTIGKDPYPVWDNTHGLVYETTDGEYHSALSEADFPELINSVIENEIMKWSTTLVERKLVEEYATELRDLKELSFQEFLKAYDNLKHTRTALENSKTAYEAYIAVVEQLTADLEANDDFAGESRDLLEDYLREVIEPNEAFPHGSYFYIIETCEMNAADIGLEIEFAKQLFNNAVAMGYGPGADLNKLLVNPDFSQTGFKGWTSQPMPSVFSTPNAETTKYLVNYNKTSYEFRQSIHGLKPGIYELILPGYTEIANGIALGIYNYVGNIFANDMQNLVKTQYSDLIAEEEISEGGVLAEKADHFAVRLSSAGEVLGYAPSVVEGVSNAIDAGHYDNRIVVNITGDSLTIGARNIGAYGLDNISYYGNLHLYYLGEMENDLALEGMDEVLASMQEMGLNLTEDFMPDVFDYREAPNFSQDLKDELAACINEVPTAETGAQKYALIKRFSDLYPAIVSCKRAYAQLVEVYNNLHDAYDKYASDEKYIAIQSKINNMIDIFLNGSASEEEVLALINEAKDDIYYQIYIGIEPELVDGYYQIASAANLVWFAEKVNSGSTNINGKLTADIDLAVISNFEPIGYYSEEPDAKQMSYRGKFDGQGFVVKNLKIERSDGCEAGLFSRTIQAELSNIGIENATIISNPCKDGRSYRAGVLAGEAHLTPVTNCFTCGEIIVQTEHLDCHGLCGETAGSIVTGCWTTYPSLTGAGTVTSCFAGVSEEDLTSGKLCYDINNALGETRWYQTLGEDDYPLLDSTHKQVYATGMENCDGTPKGSMIYSNTEGTTIRDPHILNDIGICTVCGYDAGAMSPVNDWYEISTPYNLRYFSTLVKNGNQFIKGKLMNDIDMSSMSNFYPIGEWADDTSCGVGHMVFGGTFDGQGHIIRNLQVSVDKPQEAGLFGRCGGATIKNLGLVNVSVVNTMESGGSRLGGLLGEAAGTVITNVFVAGDIVLKTTHSQTGGIAGEAAGAKLTNCYTTYTTLCAQGTKTNCYEGDEAIAKGATGELCYLLNCGNTNDPVWRQTLGEDEWPMFNENSRIVYLDDDGASYTNEIPNKQKLHDLIAEAKALSESTKSYDQLITSASQLSANCGWEEQGSLDNLLDGDLNTYFHSNPQITLSSGTEYLQVNFNEPVEEFSLEFTGRCDGAGTGNSWHDTPNQIKFKVSFTPESEFSWIEYGTQNYDLPNADGTYYMSSEPINLGGQYRAIRLYVLHTTSNMEYWNLSELQMYSAEMNDTCQYMTVEGLADAVDQMDGLVSADEAILADGTAVTQDVLDELSHAIENVNAILAGSIDGIEVVSSDVTRKTDDVYTLTGTKLSSRAGLMNVRSLPRGIYIVKGQKVLVR